MITSSSTAPSGFYTVLLDVADPGLGDFSGSAD
jgi:hypothetical protein